MECMSDSQPTTCPGMPNIVSRFLWVKYQLEDIRTQRNEHDLRNQLRKLPCGLDETYSRILEKIDQLDNTQKDLAYKALKWITCATRSLKSRELLEATALEPWGRAFEPPKVPDIADLIKACCNLVLLDSRQGVVRFAHHSVQEFLLSRPEFSSAQELVASVCINLFGPWQRFMVPVSNRPTADWLYHYAARNWPLHVQKLSAVSIRQVLPIIREAFSDTGFSSFRWMDYPEHPFGKLPPSQAPAYLAVCSFFGITSAVELFLQDETTGLQAKWFALRAAAAAGNQALVQLLLENGVDINAQDGNYGNALQEAVYNGQKRVIRFLLENGADINAQGGKYGNALQAAAYSGHEAVVRLLLEHGADINAQGGKYGNALQAAAYSGHEAVVRLLLEHGADTNAQGGECGNALQAAACYGREAVVRLLLEHGADISAQGGEHGDALQAAVRYGREAVVRLLLEHGADINAQGGEYGDALQAAVRYGREAVVRLLLEHGADINAQGSEYGNALQAAAYYGHEAVVRLLLRYGADINARGGEYGNALQAVALHGQKGMVRLLLEYGADTNAQGGEYGNALQAAAYYGHEVMVRLLLEHGADINARGGKYGNALQAAAYSGHEVMVRLLLEHGADINAQGGKYGNALQAAAYNRHEAVVRSLLEHGADINTQGGKYGNALQAATPHGREAVVRFLLEYGGDISARSGDYVVPLLVDAGANTEHKDNSSQATHHILKADIPKSDVLGGYQVSPEAREQAGDDTAPPLSDGETDRSNGEADISDHGSILSVTEPVFSTDSSQLRATSIGQVPPEAREQAEDAIARVLAKNPGVSTIVSKGVGKLDQQRVERLMAKALKQFSSVIKPSLDKDKPLLRDSFSFIERRAAIIAPKILELTQSFPTVPDQTAIEKYLEDSYSYKVRSSSRIDRWQDSGPGTSDETLTFHASGPEYTDGEELSKIYEEGKDGELVELNEEGQGEELGEHLLRQITENLASDKIAGDFLCAVKSNFTKVKLFALCRHGGNS